MIEWKPFDGMQTSMLQSKCFETLAGGSRGPGKTDGGVMWLIKPYLLKEPRARALVIRKNSDDLGDWLDRARYWYKRYGGEVTGKPGLVKFPSGYTIKLGHLKDDQAYTKYQGQEFQRILIEELTQIPEETRYLKLISSCRSTLPGLEPRIMATTNPGGVGHTWVMERWKIDSNPKGNEVFTDNDSGLTRIFLPGSVDDNTVLMDNDPGYIKMLDALKNTDEELWKAWRMGDWNTFSGQYFKEWRPELHICRPFIPDKSHVIVGGLDWGRIDPFAFYLIDVEKMKFDGTSFYRAKVFMEIYGNEKNPAEWSEIILKKMHEYEISMSDVSWVRADTQIYQKGLDNRALDIYTQFVQANDGFRVLKPANKDRIGGWSNLHQWLSIAPDGLPYLQVSTDCPNFIKTFPRMIHDENKKEDVAEGQDHAGDAVRYGMMGLKWIDGKAGAVSQKGSGKIKKMTAQFIGEQQVGINTNAWITPNTVTKNGVGGIIRR